MADRKQFLTQPKPDPELLRLLAEAKNVPVSEEVLREQKVSFVYGNAMNNDLVTKESVRRSLQHLSLNS